MTRLRSRLKALEKKRPHHGTYTLEELCRVIWRHDRERFREVTAHSSCRLLIPQFEREQADRRIEVHLKRTKGPAATVAVEL
jgi:hypothetical protein